jgi:hypothetical protein
MWKERISAALRACITIQSNFRRRLAHQDLFQHIDAVVNVQKVWRGTSQRSRLARAEQYSLSMQQMVDTRQARTATAVVAIQSKFRAHHAHQHLLECWRATLCIQ